MALAHAQSGEVISVRPLGAALSDTVTQALFKTDAFEVIRLVLMAGKGLPAHRVSGEVTVQCLEGRLEFTSPGGQKVLEAGDLVCLSGGAPHGLTAVEDASVLLTIRLGHGPGEGPV